ncbi:envelope protein UL20 [Equid alphaherpesvirus 4]|nr:envelope protein UL20 [Equid alphaherpesvirus 4]QYL35312.1 envelope protein UL20 [Equid alphaherpesvirus 4]QYL35389.1 envelope protein UL20 [Equid alphaherpesvirus 4]QYL35467.1 envelope protein UL20 [Equid alphaherpesvirus 4]
MPQMGNTRLHKPLEDSIPLIENDENSSQTEVDLYDYVSMSSYGGDSDFLISSAGGNIAPDSRPSFSVCVFLFSISALVVKPVCCFIFLNHYVITGSYDFAVAGGVCTIVYYMRLAITAWFMFRNIQADMLPLNTLQQFFIGCLAFGRTVAFLVVAYTTLFIRSELFFSMLAPNAEQEYITPIIAHKLMPLISVRSAVCLVIISTAVYAADAICDTIGFAIPRMWMCILMRSTSMKRN